MNKCICNISEDLETHFYSKRAREMGCQYGQFCAEDDYITECDCCNCEVSDSTFEPKIIYEKE